MKNENDRYISVKLSQLVPEVPLPADLFLFVNGHFIKYKTEGDVLPAVKYNEFFAKKVDFVFCLAEKIQLFDHWYSSFQTKAKEEMLQNAGPKNLDLVEKREEVRLATFNIFSGDVTDEKCRELQEKTRQFTQILISRKSSQACLTKICNYSPSLAEHSANVATLAVYLALNLGYSHQLILENVFLGALLHDFGKTRIDAHLLEKAQGVDYEALMKTHVQLGKDALLTMSNLPQEVIKIVAEHHEHDDGSGYPKKIRGTRMYELAKIVSIANIFDNYAQTAKGTNKERQKYALSKLESDHQGRFDPRKLQKCLEVLRYGL